MATKYTFISLGPAAMQILEMDRKLRRSESAKRAANKRLQTWLAQQVADGNYFEWEGGTYMVEKNGKFFDVTDQVALQQEFDNDLDFSLDDLSDEELMDDYDETLEDDEDEDVEDNETLRQTQLMQDVYSKALQYLLDYTPVDTGNLVDALYATNNGDSCIIGFDMRKAPYAVYQHENVALVHSNGRAKYLELAVIEALAVVDTQHELNANIEVAGLHEGAKLEAQISFNGPNNLGLLLADEEADDEFIESARSEFGHDYAADVNAFYQYYDLFSEVGDAGLLDMNLLSSMTRNRRMNLRTLGKVTENDLREMLSANVKAGNSAYATTALGAILLKNRINYKKAQFKMQHAHDVGAIL